ncbi:MAG: glycosyltransferase family 39 protein [Clostridia bacterium]|nr:glycosyltransferase family 39 protein [Clostridia bacterium]
MKRRLIFIILFSAILILLSGCGKAEVQDYGVNLISDGGFEGDLYEFWDKDVWVQIEGFTNISIEDEGGNHVLKIENTSLNDAKMKQTVKVEPKQVYKLSGYIKVEDSSYGKGANLSYENMFFYTEELFDTDGQYRYVELYGKTAKGQETLTVFARLGGYSNESMGTAWFDDIRLEKVEEAPEGVAVYSLEESKPQKAAVSEEGKVKFSGWMVLISIIFIAAFFFIKQSLDYDEDKLTKEEDGRLYRAMFAVIILMGLLIRSVLAVAVAGYPNDIGCWLGWSSIAADRGIAGIYDGSSFVDYPPGYMYVLYVIGWLNKIPFFAENAAATVKIPPILADIAMSLIIYKIAKSKLNEKAALLLASIYYLSPAIITDSAAWGQIDSVLALMVTGYVVFLNKKNFVAAGAFLGAGVLIKPQMGFFVFVYITAVIFYMKEKGFWKGVLEFLKGTAAGIAAFALISIPVIISRGPLYIINLFIEILSSYSSVSLNACNIWPLMGGMWERVDAAFLGATYSVWGWIGMGIAVIIFFVVSFKDRSRKNIFFNAALLVTGIFMLAGKMHERYMYTAMALLLISYIYTKDRRHFVLFGIFTLTQFANTSIVLANQYMFGFRLGGFMQSMMAKQSFAEWISTNSMFLWTAVISLSALAGYIYMIYVGLKPVDAKRQEENDRIMKEERSSARQAAKESTIEEINSPKYTGLFKSLGKKDWIIMGVLSLVYAVVAFYHLGNNYGPETMWNVTQFEQEVIVDFGEEVEIDKIMFFRAQGTNGSNFTVDFADENMEDAYHTSYYYRIDDESKLENLRPEIVDEYNLSWSDSEIMFSNYPAIFKWYEMDGQDTARYARITLHKPLLRLVEMVFIGADGKAIPISDIIISSPDAADAILLFDEQGTVPDRNTYMNSTYFDEIYHAGTAWEHIMYYNPYETTHPPLGKVIMSLGIRMFGMNPFGWRFMGTIVGILMIPVMYLLGMVVFKKTRYATIAAFLMAFDFMHFTQTRIATIDSYGVFFIMLMFLCMGIYYRMSFYKTSLFKTLIPLFFSGVFFGLGAASKWIGLYAGAGLAVIFFYTIIRRYIEYNMVNRSKAEETGIDEEQAEHIRKSFKKNTLITITLCIVFFIVIPLAIYAASYIPILKVEEGRGIEYIINSQKYMFSYHSGLNSEHPFASPWYEWPLIIKPMWYYSDNSLQGMGRMTSIAALGNPAVWWAGVLAFLWMLITMFRTRKTDKMKLFLTIAFLAQYVPWMFITRSTFIYHYFASVPFIILMTVMMIRTFEEKKRYRKEYTYAYMAIVLALFVLFYPVIAGAEISSAYGSILKWMPTWWFTY